LDDISKWVYHAPMNSIVFGQELARRRREAGLTQQQVADRMGTTQEAISRIEAGRRLPNVSFVDRYAKAIGRSIPLVFGESRSASSQERRRRVERALGKDAFNPWDRNPAPPEVESLLADGLTRERFDSQRTAGASQR
jgi:transcriptional regulator with XRE-family HTH domain